MRAAPRARPSAWSRRCGSRRASARSTSAEIGVSRVTRGAINATQLKVPASRCSRPAISRRTRNRESLVLSDKRRGIYKRVVLEDNTVCGAVLFGDMREAARSARTDRRPDRHRRDPRPAAVRFAGRSASAEHAGAPPELPVRTAAWAAACWRQRDERRRVDVRGDPAHPANRGKLCSRARALGETLGLEDRLLHPQVRGERVAWDDATRHVAARVPPAASTRTGPDSVALYVSGQLLTEDYYVANKLDEGLHRHARTSTPTRGCAWPRPWPATSARSARTSCRCATTISSQPI